MTSIAVARTRVTKALAGLEIPAAFQLATVNAALNATERNTLAAKVSRRRLVEKAERLAGVEVRS